MKIILICLSFVILIVVMVIIIKQYNKNTKEKSKEYIEAIKKEQIQQKKDLDNQLIINDNVIGENSVMESNTNILTEIKTALARKYNINTVAIFDNQLEIRCARKFLWQIFLQCDNIHQMFCIKTRLFQVATSKYLEVFQLINEFNIRSVFLKLYHDWDGVYAEYDIPIMENMTNMAFIADIVNIFIESTDETFIRIPHEYLGV